MKMIYNKTFGENDIFERNKYFWKICILLLQYIYKLFLVAQVLGSVNFKKKKKKRYQVPYLLPKTLYSYWRFFTQVKGN